jgi:hypothetical protein
VIYSRWRPDKGGYDYYKSAERRGFGDDLPNPKLGTSFNAIGVASVDCGRKPEGRLVPAGSGTQARGMMMPVSRKGLSGVPVVDTMGPWLLVGIALAVGWVLGRKSR